MFKTVKRIIDWCGEFKGKLYLGFVMTFLSHIFTAMPLALAAYTVGSLVEARMGGAAFDRAWVWRSAAIQVVLVLLRFLFDYLRARLVRTTTCADGDRCDYAICGDRDPFLREHPEYRDAQGYRRNR